MTCDGEDAAGLCDRWTITAGPDDLACAGESLHLDNQAYRLPFALEVEVIE